MAKKQKELNRVAEQILAVLEEKCGRSYADDKRLELTGMDPGEALFWATYKLDASNLAALAERLGVDAADFEVVGRVLRVIY